MDDLNDTDPVFQKYRCYLRSAPGMWERYEGYVDVFSPNEEEVFERAVRELTRTSFPDRWMRDSWIFESSELVS